MTNDEYDQQEIPCPYTVVPNGPTPVELEGIDRLKLCSTAAATAAASTTTVAAVPVVVAASGTTTTTTAGTNTIKSATEKPPINGVDGAAGGVSTLDKPANPPSKLKKTPSTVAASAAATSNALKKDGKKKVVPM